VTHKKHRLALYAVTIFLSSALLMVLEIAAARLIAPYVGVSLYTWTSVIGVILAGLSLGNWLGGVWSDRGAGHGVAAGVLIATGLTCLAILLLLLVVAGLIQQSELSLLSASFLYVLSLFFVPALLIGVVAPLLTTLALALNPRTGHVVGMMHALAALGSIVGTFVTGYWLIQYLGTKLVITVTAGLFFLMALPFLSRRAPAAIIAIVLLATPLAWLTHLRQGFVNPCDDESQYFCIRVVNANEHVPVGSARAMILDHLLHGINHMQYPELLASPYVHAMDELISHHLGEDAATASYFFAGGGSYTQPRAIKARHPGSRVTVAEIDPQVTAAAVDQLDVDPGGMDIHHSDARVTLQRWRGGPFDVVVGDVFHDVAVPYHLTTLEYAELVSRRLTTDGLYVLNVVDAYPDPLLARAIVRTLNEVFRHVDIWLEQAPAEPSRLTYVISATNGNGFPDELQSTTGIRRSWRKHNEELIAGRSLANVPLLSDDHVPVERLISRLMTTGLGL